MSCSEPCCICTCQQCICYITMCKLCICCIFTCQQCSCSYVAYLRASNAEVVMLHIYVPALQLLCLFRWRPWTSLSSTCGVSAGVCDAHECAQHQATATTTTTVITTIISTTIPTQCRHFRPEILKAVCHLIITLPARSVFKIVHSL